MNKQNYGEKYINLILLLPLDLKKNKAKYLYEWNNNGYVYMPLSVIKIDVSYIIRSSVKVYITLKRMFWSSVALRTDC